MAKKSFVKKMSVVLLISIFTTTPFISTYAATNIVANEKSVKESQVVYNNWYKNLVGKKANQNETALLNSIAENDKLVSTEDKKGFWDTMVKNPTNFLWSNLPIGTSSANITSNFKNVYTMAQAYSLPNSKFYKNQELKNDIITALKFLNDKAYNDKMPKIYGNWWDFEIGTPLVIVNTLTLMKDDLDKTTFNNYLLAIDNFVPDPVKRKSLNKPAFNETAANLLDKSFAVMMRGVLGDDEEKIKLGVKYIDSTFVINKGYKDFKMSGDFDGFYTDGSFIQHDNIAYAGGYGSVFLQRVSDFLTALKDTSYLNTLKNINNVYKFIADSFVPLFYKGAIMDNTRGRGISRKDTNDHTTGRSILICMNKIAKTNPDINYRKTYQGFVKSMILSDDSFLNYTSGLGLSSVQSISELLNDSTIPSNSDKRNEFKTMNFMKRYVAQRGNYAAGLSLFSDKMSSFEYGNDENKKGFYLGTGVLNIYNDDTTQYSGNYWPTVDMGRLPGITTDGLLGKLKAWKSYLNTKTYVGGSTDGVYGAVGFEFSNINVTESDLSGRKSWFFFDNEIVALGSKINSTSNSPVETIIENRKLKSDDSNNVILQDADGTSNITSSNKFAYIKGKTANTGIGYYIPDNQNVSAEESKRSGAWSEISPSKNSDIVNEYYGCIRLNHGVNPIDASYKYIIVPNKTLADTKDYSKNCTVKILKNSNNIHAVHETKKNIVCINFFEPDTYNNYTASTPLSVLIKDSKASTEYYISDPTMQQQFVEIKVKLDDLENYVIKNNSAVVINPSDKTVTIKVSTTEKDGATHKITLEKKDKKVK